MYYIISQVLKYYTVYMVNWHGSVVEQKNGNDLSINVNNYILQDIECVKTENNECVYVH